VEWANNTALKMAFKSALICASLSIGSLSGYFTQDLEGVANSKGKIDKPSQGKPTQGLYYDEDWHAKIETKWDEACTPVGIDEELFDRERSQDSEERTPLSEFVTFELGNEQHLGEIKTYYIDPDDLMEFLIDLCITSKERSLKLFPIDNPDNVQFDDNFNDLTRKIFTASIGNLISVWSCIWAQENP